ncbi:BnaUnng03680D [Brassica napus]|uniref:BnaUnng03680D protein n=1 Tax=Brassica napus TaxID=3708 RepID=A0A078JX16_BRANA|nr:BnaUnng03680D [Brassica napus]
MMSESASGSTLPSLETSNNETRCWGTRSKERRRCTSNKRRGKDDPGLILVALSKGQRPENSQNWNAIDRLLAAPNGKEEYYETDLDSDDDNKEVKYKSVAELLTQNVETLTEDIDEDDEDNDADGTNLVTREKKCKKEFICDVCGKVFGSYQALGGHRTSHKCKRLKICDKNDQDRELVPNKKNDQDRRHQCGVCGREFESGQALGGHMKTHYI